MCEEQFNESKIAVKRCLGERPVAAAIDGVDVCAPIQQQLGDIQRLTDPSFDGRSQT